MLGPKIHALYPQHASDLCKSIEGVDLPLFAAIYGIVVDQYGLNIAMGEPTNSYFIQYLVLAHTFQNEMEI